MLFCYKNLQALEAGIMYNHVKFPPYHSIHPDQHGPQGGGNWEVDAQQSVEEKDEGDTEHHLTGDDVR